MSLIETIRGCFGRKEKPLLPLTDADRYRIWELKTTPVCVETVKLVTERWGEIQPGNPGYTEEVAKRKAVLLGQNLGCNVLEKPEIDPFTGVQINNGKTVLVAVPIGPTPKAA